MDDLSIIISIVTRFFSPLLAASLLFSPQSLKSAAVTDYWAFGVSQARLYGFTSETTRTTIAFSMSDVPNSVTNHLATDAAFNRVIYGVNSRPAVVGDPSPLEGIWAWNFEDNSAIDITNGYDLAGVIGPTTGGGSFYNGAYYLWDDEGPEQGLVKFTFGIDEFAADYSLINSMTKPWGDMTGLNLGSFGDIAIDANGTLFALTATNRLYRMDLKDPMGSPSLQGDYTGYASNGQLFIDNLGRLLTRQSGSGNWLRLNPDQPGLIEVISGPTTFNTYEDLAEGPVVGVVVPEPSAILFVGLAGSLSFLRRRRTSK